MNTCEQCGADAVDTRGVCRICGWQAWDHRYSDEDDAPSLGETRAADIPAGGFGSSGTGSPSPRGSRLSQFHADAGATALVGGATSGGRFCGTCGARLESGTAFCGQCGTPVAASTPGGLTFGTSGLRPSGQEKYHVGGWSDGDGNELTEAMAGAPTYNGLTRPGVGPGLPQGGAPFHPSGYGAARSGAAAPSSHTTRLVVGVFCLIGSIISASAAIILAITK